MRCRAIIVDDEALGRRGIAARLTRYPDVEVAALCSNGREAIDAVRRLSPNLLFLDVKMPAFDGFEVVEALGAAGRPHVIFVTAYDDYAIRAFKVQALDYLLKPIDDERFEETMQRAFARLGRDQASDIGERVTTVIGGLLACRPGRTAPALTDRFVVRAGGKLILLRHAEIDWIEAAGDYVRLHTGTRTWLFRQTLSQVEQMLGEGSFLRIHRSTIVNVDRIKELHPYETGDMGVLLQSGTKLRASRTYREAVRGLTGSPD